MELYRMTATQLRRMLGERRITAEQLVRCYMERIEKYDGANGLNTVSELNPEIIEQARALDASGEGRSLPLWGLPVLVKDNTDVAGLHTTAGSLAIADNVARSDAPVIKNLRANGALILGKANMTEFANYTADNMRNGYSSKAGYVRNAYNRDADPSGSSSGSGVAVSAGLCALAVGTDTSFSVVGCAAANGVCGLKPPIGALSQQGIVPIAHTLDSAGALTRSFSDALLLYNGMRDAALPEIKPAEISGLHIAVNTVNREKMPAAKQERHNELFERLKNAGAILEDTAHSYMPQMKYIMQSEFRHDLEAYLAGSTAKRRTLAEIVDYYEANPQTMMKYGDACLRAALDKTEAPDSMDYPPYVDAMRVRDELRGQLDGLLGRYDACCMAGPVNFMHFAGIPSVALPVGMGSDGLPVGLIMYGLDETRLYAAALAIEKFCDADIFPPM